MAKADGEGPAAAGKSGTFGAQSSPFVVSGGELPISNLGQLELLRAATERGASFRTGARGFSMAPFIRDKDVVTIAPLHGQEPRLGEVIAFIQADTGRLTVHRVTARSGAGWVVRGDNSPEANGVVMRGEIVVRVVRVERAGRGLRLCLGVGGRMIAVLNRGQALTRLRRLWRSLRGAAAFVLRSAQGVPLWRAVGRRLAPRYEITEATQTDVEDLQHCVDPPGHYTRQSTDSHVTNWVAKIERRVIGFVQFVDRPEPGCVWMGQWLFSLAVWGRYRGLGVGEALTRHVIELARGRAAAADLFLAVSEDNERAIGLYRKLGFVHTVLTALQPEFVLEKQQLGRRRLVMCKRLGEGEM